MRLDPDHTQQMYDAGWVDGYDQGRLEGFSSGYRAAIAASGELLERVPGPRPHRRSTVPPAATPAGTQPATGTSGPASGGAALVERARRSWQPPAPDPGDAGTGRAAG